jgi:hypothetical protein
MSTLATGDDAQMQFESLEEGQHILQQQSIAISQNLTRINAALECLTRQCVADETMVHGGDTLVEVSSMTSSVTMTKQRKIKLSQPSDFNRNHTKDHVFINSCMLYTSLCPEEFTNDIQQVCWVLTFMKKDHAAIFADCTIWSEHQTGLSRFQTWESFYTTFVSLFCPINESMMALIKLEMEDYHQNKHDVDEYVNDFEELINLLGYMDPLTIVIKFCQGLNATIQNKIAELGKDRPGDNSPAGWYTMAQLFNQNHIANHAFQNPNKKSQTPSATPSTGHSIFPCPLMSQASHASPSISQSCVTTRPMLGSGIQCSDHIPHACF